MFITEQNQFEEGNLWLFVQYEIMYNISPTWMMHLPDNQGIYLAMGVATSKPGSRDRAIENAMRLLDAGEVSHCDAFGIKLQAFIG